MSENENDFEALRRLLALKRHEVPPPGYFEDFSSRVVGRIRAAQAVRQLPWLLRLLQAFESKPAYPVAFASALCTLLLFGIVSVEQSPELINSPASAAPINTAFSFDGPGPLAYSGMASNSPSADVSLFDVPQPSAPVSPQLTSFSVGGN
jgi:hypothetical protein